MGLISRVCAFILLATIVLAVSAQADKQVSVIEGQELIVFAKSGTSANAFSSVASQRIKAFGGSAQIKFLGPKLAVAALSSKGNSFKLANESDLLAACSRIKSSTVDCEINYTVSASIIPNDASYSSLYGLAKIGAPAAWDITTGSHAVKVAVVDTGVDYSHPDLSANISVNSAEIPSNGIDDDNNGRIDDYYGYDFANSDSNPADDNAHGTHVAGTIGAVGNNSSGVVGVNWSVGIIPVKVLAGNGSGSTAGVIAGIDYAIARGANVINMSLGGAGYSQAFYDSVERAKNAGILVVAAAGNENNNNDGVSPSYPASFNLPNVISVAATTSADTRASFSNYGANSVHLAAPGFNIYSTIPGSTYATYSGTSMACPHVAGAAALVKAANSGLNMLQVKDLLLNNVDVIPALSGLVATSGRLNVARAVAAATGTSPAPEPAPPTPAPTPVPGDGNDGGGGGTAPGDGVDNPSDSVLDYLDVETTVKGRKASIVAVTLDQDDYELPDVTVTINCANKQVAQKVTDDYGEAVFSYKLKSSSVKCIATAVDLDGVTTKKKGFRIKLPKVRSR